MWTITAFHASNCCWCNRNLMCPLKKKKIYGLEFWRIRLPLLWTNLTDPSNSEAVIKIHSRSMAKMPRHPVMLHVQIPSCFQITVAPFLNSLFRALWQSWGTYETQKMHYSLFYSYYLLRSRKVIAKWNFCNSVLKMEAICCVETFVFICQITVAIS